MLQSIVYEFSYGKNKIKLETGLLARQATSSVMASMGDTIVLVTIVCAEEVKLDQKFFPLSVFYQEKFYSIGRIPGGFYKREGRSSDIEIIISRLIDRSIRPLFRDNFLYEIQIVVNVISVDPLVNTDIISIIGVSAALSISGIPFNGPLGVARIGYINGNYILNPILLKGYLNNLDLVISGTIEGISMIDSSSKNLSEEIILGAINFGYSNLQKVIKNIEIFSEKYFSTLSLKNNFLKLDKLFLSEKISRYIDIFCKEKLNNAYFIIDKKKRFKEIDNIKKQLFFNLNIEKEVFYEALVLNKILNIEKDILINRLLNFNIRIDGRNVNDIRNLDIKTNFLPKRVHGSALFTRGDTQALVTITLGTYKDSQSFDDVNFGERLDKFIFHYNFPPYSVGEIGNINIPKRREIGHGYLIKKGILPVMPNADEFPYTIRIVSEILESNGSSSMASVCGASLALMDAGVPIKHAVAGIAMGLIQTDEKNFILSDIISDEDKLGDMDFKIVGTLCGITALQMDMKIIGIDFDIIKKSLFKAKEARLSLLSQMNLCISLPNRKLSLFAPRIYKIKVDIDQIKNIIGKGGSVIKSLTDNYRCLIEIGNDGIIKIISYNKIDAKNVINIIKKITTQVKLGVIYQAKIIKIVDFGIFVSFLNNKEGLIHISQISSNKIINIFKYFKIGQYISVKVLEINKSGKFKLSVKDIYQKKK